MPLSACPRSVICNTTLRQVDRSYAADLRSELNSLRSKTTRLLDFRPADRPAHVCIYGLVQKVSALTAAETRLPLNGYRTAIVNRVDYSPATN